MPPSSYGFDWPTNSDFSGLAPSNLSDPPIAQSAGARSSFSSQIGHHPDLMYQQPSLHSPELQSAQPTAGQRELAGRSEFPGGGEPMDFDKSPLELYLQLGMPFNKDSHEPGQAATHSSRHGSTSNPTDISTLASSSSSSSRDAAGVGTGLMAKETSAAVVDAVAAYGSSVIRRECEVVGVATAVADYIAWVRKVPSTGAPPITNSVYQQMMANIEVRVRELIEIAQQRHEGPLRDLLGALEGSSSGAVAARVASLEADFQRQLRDHTHFFETNYDACKRLSDQARNRP